MFYILHTISQKKITTREKLFWIESFFLRSSLLLDSDAAKKVSIPLDENISDQTKRS